VSAWRRLALQLFPEHRRIIQSNEFIFSIYQLFFDLLPMTIEAHEIGNNDFLRRVYQFAEWCWKQKPRSDDVYNAVCVSFYEHLVDHVASRNSIQYWLKPEIFEDIRDIFPPRMTEDEYKQLLDLYNSVNHTNFE
jgi:hypothetical protein